MKIKEAYQAKYEGSKVWRNTKAQGPDNWKGKTGIITQIKQMFDNKPYSMMCSVSWDDGSFGNHPARILELVPEPTCANLATRGARRMRI